MILSRNNQVHRFLNQYGIAFPSTNLCGLFWQTVGMSVALTLAGVIIGVYLIGLWETIVGFPMNFPIAVFVIGTTFAVFIGITAGLAHFADTDTSEKWANNAAEALEGIKEQYCPVVSWKD